jgi:tetratricopeptide (TPR) repeat protein
MLVYPESPHVEIVYSRNLIDWIGLWLTLAGVALAVGCAVSPALDQRLRSLAYMPFEPVALALSRRPLLAATSLAILAASAGAAARYTLTAPERAFQEAKTAYKDRDFASAIEGFRAWTAHDSGTFKQATALYQLGVSHSELGHHAAAVQILERLQFEFPNVDYDAGTLYHLAKSYAGLGMSKRAREAAALLRDTKNGAAWSDRLRRNHPELL